jgi:hypothetical protein
MSSFDEKEEKIKHNDKKKDETFRQMIEKNISDVMDIFRKEEKEETTSFKEDKNYFKFAENLNQKIVENSQKFVENIRIKNHEFSENIKLNNQKIVENSQKFVENIRIKNHELSENFKINNQKFVENIRIKNQELSENIEKKYNSFTENSHKFVNGTQKFAEHIKTNINDKFNKKGNR